MKKNKTPTIEDFISDYYPDQGKKDFSIEQVRKMLKGFADIYVQAALEKASEEVFFDQRVLVRQSILQAYPLTNIK